MAEINHKAEIFEDKKYIINAPYNFSKEIFNTVRFNVKIWKENGDDNPFVVIREKKVEEKDVKI